MTAGGCEIIVVDDDTSMGLAIERLLSAAGWRVCTYASAEDLLRENNCTGASLLLLDIQLPGISGLELHRKLRADGNTQPVIFITGQDRPDFHDLVRDSGAAACFTKPFDGCDLIREIRRHFPAA